MTTLSRKDELFASVAVVVLLIGTATGSARAMFVISAITLLLMVAFYRGQSRSGALLAAFVAAVTAFVIGMVVALR